MWYMKQAMIKWKLVYSGRKVFTTAVHSILFYCILYVSQITCPHGPGYINQRFFSRVGLGAAETILYDFRVFPLQSGTRRENTDPSHLYFSSLKRASKSLALFLSLGTQLNSFKSSDNLLSTF